MKNSLIIATPILNVARTTHKSLLWIKNTRDTVLLVKGVTWCWDGAESGEGSVYTSTLNAPTSKATEVTLPEDDDYSAYVWDGETAGMVFTYVDEVPEVPEVPYEEGPPEVPYEPAIPAIPAVEIPVRYIKMPITNGMNSLPDYGFALGAGETVCFGARAGGADETGKVSIIVRIRK